MMNARRAMVAFVLVASSAAAVASAAPPKRRRHVPTRRRALRGRTIDRNHPLRRQVRSEALLAHALALAGGADVATLPRHVRTAMAKKVRKPLRSLRTRKGQGALLSVLRQELGDAHYEHIVGRQAVGIKRAAQNLDDGRQPKTRDDLRDMGRGWGWRLLPKNDKAFFAPEYLARVLRETGQSGAGHFVENDPTQADKHFERAWRAVAPSNTLPVAYTLTGSDANNLMLGVAAAAARGQGKRVRAGSILTMSSAYVAGRGPLAAQSAVVGGGRAHELAVESPHTNTFHPKGAELARVRAAEMRALAQIRAKVTAMKATSTPVGAFLLEPIVGAKGAYVYRPSFMRKLRALCDTLKVPIIADEILTGGGRTGKFFAYQHYAGFEPDFITFGKGLQVAGVARVDRGRQAPHYYKPRDMVTLKGNSGALLKGAQVLERIHKDKLIENAAEVGRYFLAKLQQAEPPHSRSPNEAPGGARGVGLLLYSRKVSYDLGLRGAMGRLMPYLTLSKAEVDALFAERAKGRASTPSR